MIFYYEDSRGKLIFHFPVSFVKSYLSGNTFLSVGENLLLNLLSLLFFRLL